MKCKTHKAYKGIGKPKSQCEACWAIYLGIAEVCLNCGCSEQGSKTE